MFQGTITPLVTPFLSTKEMAVDYKTFAELIEWQISCGVSGIVVFGTTGESATLTHDEKIELCRLAVKVAKGRVPVIAGTGSNSTKATIEFTREVKATGIDATLVVCPYYNKPTQEGLVAHFSEVAKKGGLPVILYNIPGRTGVDLSIESFEKLAIVEGIVAVKESSGNPDKLMELVARVGEKLALLSGEDALTYLFMAVGGKGVISASANVMPDEFVSITSAGLKGDFEIALKIQKKILPIIRALFAESNPAPAKAALELLGKISDSALRLPLVSVRPETKKKLEDELKLLGKLSTSAKCINS